MKEVLKEFKEFAIKGNMLDLAIGVVIGGAFGKVISSLVTDIILPPFSLILGKVNFPDLYLNLSGNSYGSLTAAKAAGAATINYGIFFNNIIEFVIVAFGLFLIIRPINKLRREKEKEPTEKDCPHCFTKIPIKASRCPNCTSNLKR